MDDFVSKHLEWSGYFKKEALNSSAIEDIFKIGFSRYLSAKDERLEIV